MNVYYRHTKIDKELGVTMYELNIKYQNYIIAIYFFSRNLPAKRLTRKRPLNYFRVKKHRLSLCVSNIENITSVYNCDILIKNPDKRLLANLIGRSKVNTYFIGIDKEAVDIIINEFLKTLLVENNKI
jgi:hypothetical protein